MPALLIIADAPDALADDFARLARARGKAPDRLSYGQAALRLSVIRGQRGTAVAPACPIFLRLPFAAPPYSDDEAQFHRAEICSLVWAAAALTTAPVINRPNSYGFSGRCALSTGVLAARAGLEWRGVEVFAGQAPDPIGPADEWWLERADDRSTLPWTERGALRGPFRASRVRSGFELVVVTVVGAAPFGEHPSVQVGLGARSVEVCKSLDVGFATVMWRWYPQGAEAEFAGVNPHPRLEEIGGSWPLVADQLVAELPS
jgi:hypothetical protein